jgi:hypothetical protein
LSSPKVTSSLANTEVVGGEVEEIRAHRDLAPHIVEIILQAEGGAHTAGVIDGCCGPVSASLPEGA